MFTRPNTRQPKRSEPGRRLRTPRSSHSRYGVGLVPPQLERRGSRQDVQGIRSSAVTRMTGSKASRLGHAVGDGVMLAICCLISYQIITYIIVDCVDRKSTRLNSSHT